MKKLKISLLTRLMAFLGVRPEQLIDANPYAHVKLPPPAYDVLTITSKFQHMEPLDVLEQRLPGPYHPAAREPISTSIIPEYAFNRMAEHIGAQILREAATVRAYRDIDPVYERPMVEYYATVKAARPIISRGKGIMDGNV